MFEVEASSLDELFEDAGKAVMATMAELKTVKPSIHIRSAARRIKVRST